MRRVRRPWSALVLALAAGPAGAGPPSALEPPSTGGIVELDRDLAKLQVHARLLVVGAHPDDEDTSLLALVARGMGGEAAYLSLSRGEGGQNLIGPELGVDLGLLRSRELLAARRLDGGRQYFTRAFDFGYTRSLEETLRLWPREVLLEDVVRVVRRFRPQVMVSIFPGDGGGGHGQHQAAGLAAHEAFSLAGDPARFPARSPGEEPAWQPAALYRSTWFDRDQTTLVVPTGNLDPPSGRSVFQIAMASRSMHRSQDMGRLQEPGPRASRLGWVAGGTGVGGAVLFAGMDTRLRAIAEALAPGPARERLWTVLAEIEEEVARARAELRPSDPATVAPLLRAVLLRLREERAAVPAGVAGREAALALLDEKVAAAERALAAALGLVVDAVADREAVVRGEPFEVTVSLWNATREAVPVPRVELVARAGWQVAAAPAASEAVQEAAAGSLAQWPFQVEVRPGSAPTIPYFLRRPLAGALYDWSDAPAALRGEPFEPPPLSARVTLSLDGLELELEREVVHRFADQALGEIRRPLRAVPPLEIEVEPRLLVWPLGAAGERVLEVTLAGRARGALAGRLETTPPEGWTAPPPRPFALAENGGRQTLRIALRAPAGLRPGRSTVRLAAALAGGERVELAVPLVDHPHIRPTPRPRPAAVEVSAADLALPALQSVAYVRGASDAVPELLAAVGVPLVLLDGAALAAGDLAPYDAIVLGSRAYETDAALRAANPRLLDYVRGGGTLIVQYQQYPFVEGGYAPLPLMIGRPHDRVTDESAPVTILAPEHPALTTPNRLDASDWEGWVQERGLYFAREWDPAYTPLLEMADPGGPPQRGGLLVARVGEGTYVYTGFAFFRQLPAGVPGAYRLFANLLGLGR